jgi:hypothetical protein
MMIKIYPSVYKLENNGKPIPDLEIVTADQGISYIIRAPYAVQKILNKTTLEFDVACGYSPKLLDSDHKFSTLDEALKTVEAFVQKKVA